MVEESDYIRPPTLTPEEEAEEERKAVKLNRLKKQPTFQNEKKGQLALDGLGLGDFTRNREFGRAKLLKSLKENDHEWVHLLFFESEKKNLKWLHYDYYGQLPWSVACSNGSTRCLKEMVKFSGIDKIGKTSAGQSPLFQAVNGNKADTVFWLLDRKDVEGKELFSLPKYDINDVTIDGRTPLWQAAYKGFDHVAKMLIKFGANTLKLSKPDKNAHLYAKKLAADDICLLKPHLERVKVVSIGSGTDPHRINVGDEVDAKYKGSEKFYPARVTKVNDDHTYDVEFHDGAKEEGIDKKGVHKKVVEKVEEVVESDSEEEVEEEVEVEVEEVVGGGGGDGDEPPNPPEEGGAAPPGALDEVPGEVVMVKKKIKRMVKRKKHKKVKVRYMLSKLEVDTTTEFLKPVAWLGTLPSEAAKANNHDKLAKVLAEEEEKTRKGAKKKFRAVQALAVGMFAGRDEQKYEGMV
ncbi:hypothetical protein TL16_g04701 [Triparma laevis f. inornata]|uniref:Uncharacterized protein n=1 Tax=Triparma laevis f. inornata TaxID=1714386 RepID=A0A9W7A7S7_9STRA|nr:hypothetical protein TL16_g04701 [Triparma laevis f. inornata]